MDLGGILLAQEVLRAPSVDEKATSIPLALALL